MFALIFIIITTWLGIETSTRFSQEVTWFTYYLGGVFGLFLSGIGLELWDKWKNRETKANKDRKKRTFAVAMIKE
ncbi:MAG: hypothetical protein JRJ51_19325 [Deltaproteobacteria bacterium]|nr:hypothetical protein [Deltaproteobacteria bacterium]